jgi:4-hydroxy-3-methylbut-2-en-1-yl diphosphate synthase IspG/GcpE
MSPPRSACAKSAPVLRRRLRHVPLVADIHFLPAAAMEAVEHVEKVRSTPATTPTRRRFAVREYSDSDYDAELQRLHDAFSPLVRRCRELGRALRIGTNHGSLSDRIVNRYGDSPSAWSRAPSSSCASPKPTPTATSSCR